MTGQYSELLRHWISVARRQNYWTSAAKLSHDFSPCDVSFYYRDYSPKTYWAGPRDDAGVPLVQEAGGTPFVHPMHVAQKALGHWELWQRSQHADHWQFREFMILACWLRDAQESHGGWSIESMRKTYYLVPYSAMAQGQAVSVIIRAYFATTDESFLQSAHAGIRFMLAGIEHGGTSRRLDSHLLFEEYPMLQCNAVLNGWINALFGIYDYTLFDKCDYLACVLHESITSFVAMLPRYDMGFWSFYDLTGRVASPYYHEVHIAQLTALAVTFPQYAETMSRFRQRFETYSLSRLYRSKALMQKAMQKVFDPQITVLKAPPNNLGVKTKPG